MSTFPQTVRRLSTPEAYPVWLETTLYEKKLSLIEAVKKVKS